MTTSLETFTWPGFAPCRERKEKELPSSDIITPDQAHWPVEGLQPERHATNDKTKLKQIGAGHSNSHSAELLGGVHAAGSPSVDLGALAKP